MLLPVKDSLLLKVKDSMLLHLVKDSRQHLILANSKDLTVNNHLPHLLPILLKVKDSTSLKDTILSDKDLLLKGNTQAHHLNSTNNRVLL